MAVPELRERWAPPPIVPKPCMKVVVAYCSEPLTMLRGNYIPERNHLDVDLSLHFKFHEDLVKFLADATKNRQGESYLF